MWKEYIDKLPDYPQFKSKWERQLVEIIHQTIPKADKVLEVGCSNGCWLRWFRNIYGSEVYGIDNHTIGFSKDIDFRIADARDLPYPDRSFDVVFSLGLLEHFKKEERFRILSEQRRVLKPNGFLICQVPLLSIFSPNYYHSHKI
jgi:ubiquinone/menaquinone biosynthesis C-methylase UbiE